MVQPNRILTDLVYLIFSGFRGEITKPSPEGRISEHTSHHLVSTLFWPTCDIPQVWEQEDCVNVLFRAENFTDTNFLHFRSLVLNKNRVSY